MNGSGTGPLPRRPSGNQKNDVRWRTFFIKRRVDERGDEFLRVDRLDIEPLADSRRARCSLEVGDVSPRVNF